MSERAAEPLFRVVNLMPGSVEVECCACRRHFTGLTAANVMGQFRVHIIGLDPYAPPVFEEGE